MNGTTVTPERILPDEFDEACRIVHACGDFSMMPLDSVAAFNAVTHAIEHLQKDPYPYREELENFGFGAKRARIILCGAKYQLLAVHLGYTPKRDLAKTLQMLWEQWPEDQI
jgi:hypothetical protein